MKLENYLDANLSEKIGLDALNISILKEIHKSVEIIRKDILTSSGWAYELTERFYDFYIPEMPKYEWNLKAKIKTTSKDLVKEQADYLKQIPFIDYTKTNLIIKHNKEWKNVIQTKTHLILI